MNKLGKLLGGKQYSGSAAMDWVNLIAAMFGNHFLFWAHGKQTTVGHWEVEMSGPEGRRHEDATILDFV